MKVDVFDYLEKLERSLLEKDKIEMSFARNWASQFDGDAGVYAVYDKDELIYVGETGSLKGRMKDIRRTLNHSFRRSLGEKLYSGHKSYTKATSSKKHIDEIELMLNEYCEANIKISTLIVHLGRKELEEMMTEKYDRLLNTRLKRK